MYQKFMKMMNKNKKGFTLVELMVVVVIIGILVAIAIPVYNGTQASAKLKSCQANQRTIEGAEAIAFSESGVYCSIAQLVSGFAVSGTPAAATTGSTFGPYLKATPECPSNGTYADVSLTTGLLPTQACSVHTHY